LCNRSPCSVPIQQYRVNMNIKYTDLILHRCIFILTQCVQFHEDPIALLIRALSYWSAPSAVTALPTHVDCLTLSISTLFIFTFVIIFEFILR
jgi:hypothetical protein